VSFTTVPPAAAPPHPSPATFGQTACQQARSRLLVCMLLLPAAAMRQQRLFRLRRCLRTPLLRPASREGWECLWGQTPGSQTR
jgi:hypothetical protein